MKNPLGRGGPCDGRTFTILLQVSRRLKGFASDTSANMAMIVALLLLPFMAMMALALDLSLLEKNQSRMQSSLDSAVLSAASGLSNGSVDDGELNGRFAELLNANTLGMPYVIEQGPSIEIIDQHIVGRVAGRYETIFGSFVGREEIDFDLVSYATVATARAEIVMVLDSSRSMREDLPPELDENGNVMLDDAGRPIIHTRLESLQNAANSMITELIRDGNDDARMAIVPFSHHVNVGAGRRDEAWLSVGEDEEVEDIQCSNDWRTNDYYANGCVREQFACVQDGIAGTCTRWNCPSGVSSPQTCVDRSRTRTFYGCVNSRPEPYRFQTVGWEDVPVTGQLAFNGNACASEMLDLTSDTAMLANSVDTLNPSGNTYMAAGLMWGLRVLSPTEDGPFNSAAPFNTFALENGRKAVILMSDGNNTRSPGNGSSSVHRTRHMANNSTDENFADENTLAAYNAIKGSGIELFAIAFGVEDADTRTLLESCATSVSYYYRAENALELSLAFSQIGGNFREVRLTSAPSVPLSDDNGNSGNGNGGNNGNGCQSNIDGDGNCGHGNNPDGVDPDNPGNSGGTSSGNGNSGNGNGNSGNGNGGNNGNGCQSNIDGDGNCGHGNNPDGVDPDNPGNSGGTSSGNGNSGNGNGNGNGNGKP